MWQLIQLDKNTFFPSENCRFIFRHTFSWCSVSFGSVTPSPSWQDSFAEEEEEKTYQIAMKIKQESI